MTLRIAVVGAGPSGLYAADALAAAGAEVDVLDRLPVPFGLVRYGVAPDHFSIRSVRDTLAHVLERPEVRLLAGVEVGDPADGADVSVAELLAAYDGVVLTYGAARDRRLDIDGEDLEGSIAATDFVAWYCGHPDADRETIESALATARSVVVVGVGNVAVDVTRVLTAPRERLEATDMPQHVLDALRDSRVNDVHVLGRRGPAQATWTTKELKELAELEGVDVVIDDVHDLELEPVSASLVESDRVVARNVDVLRSWVEHALDGTHKHIHLHFHSRPAALLGDGRVETVVVERTTVDETGAHGTGETYEVGAQMVVRSVGYRGVALPGVPFDARRNVIPNDEGRVVDEAGAPVAGLYVAGWIKRGPTGIIGTNKKDAAATVASLLADLDGAAGKGGDGVRALLAERGVTPIDLEGWKRIDAAERALGGAVGRQRTTLHEYDALVAASQG